MTCVLESCGHLDAKCWSVSPPIVCQVFELVPLVSRMGVFTTTTEVHIGKAYAIVVRRRFAPNTVRPRVMFFKRSTDQHGHEERSMEFTVEDLPELRVLTDEIYRMLMKG